MRNEIFPPEEWTGLITRYLTALAAAGSPKPTRTLRSYHLRRFATDCGRAPREVTVEDLLDHITRNDWSNSTVKTYRSTMRDFYGWAKRLGLVKRNPARKLPKVRVAQGMPRPASDGSLIIALTSAGPREQLMIRLASEVGLRCREIALVHRDDLEQDLLGWSLRIHGKGDKDRIVPIADDLAAVLLTFDGWVFPGNIDGHLSAAYVSKLISRVLPGATAHQLRHRFATRAYQLGGRDIRAVQELLGHASVATTQIYTAVERSALRQAVLAAA